MSLILNTFKDFGKVMKDAFTHNPLKQMGEGIKIVAKSPIEPLKAVPKVLDPKNIHPEYVNDGVKVINSSLDALYNEKQVKADLDIEKSFLKTNIKPIDSITNKVILTPTNLLLTGTGKATEGAIEGEGFVAKGIAEGGKVAGYVAKDAINVGLTGLNIVEWVSQHPLEAGAMVLTSLYLIKKI